jgi:Ca-activated chloride channel family protein
MGLYMILADFHFLYPLWFLSLPVLGWLVWWLYQLRSSTVQWDDFIDEKLRPYVLSVGSGEKNNRLVWSVAIAGIITIFALAGPSWDKRAVPAFQTQHGLVVAMDLSTSMIITDITPSRLVRSRFKLIDLLKMRKDGQTGLVVFAGAAFAVSPLTDDTKNITEQVIHLGPGIMPVQGSRLYLAIDEASQLLQQSGFEKGNILLMTDGLASLDNAIASAKKAKQQGYTVSILGIGTTKGGTIPLAEGRVYTNQNGVPIIASLDEVALQQVAKAGGGSYKTSELSDGDIRYFNEKFSLTQRDKLNNGLVEKKDREVEYWNNAGIYLTLLLLPFAVLLFRRGILFSFVLVFFTLPHSETVHAYEWDALWKNDDQRGQIALDNQQADKAVTLFKRPDWQAAAAYRNKDYKKADTLYSQFNTADADYNRGNALAKQGKYEKAIAAYEQALSKNKDLQDAKDNKALLEQLKKQQEQEKKQKQDEKQKNKDDKQDDQQEQSKQKNDDKNNRQNKNGKESDQLDEESEQKEKEAQDKQDKENKTKEQQDKKAQEDKDKKDDAEGVKDPKQHGRQGKESEQRKQQKKAEKKSEEEIRQLREKNQRAEQWLRKIPDDSAGLWRRKFIYQYRQRSTARGRGEQQPW